MPQPYLHLQRGYFYIKEKIKEKGEWKPKTLACLGRIPKSEAEERLKDWRWKKNKMGLGTWLRGKTVDDASFLPIRILYPYNIYHFAGYYTPIISIKI